MGRSILLKHLPRTLAFHVFPKPFDHPSQRQQLFRRIPRSNKPRLGGVALSSSFHTIPQVTPLV